MPDRDTSSSDSFELLRTAVAGRYAILRELGRGGMATVYLADDLKHHRQVAVKVLRPDVTSAVSSERFLREIQVAARLSHPHILALHDSGEIEAPAGRGAPFLFYVMPYVRGESLRARLDREKRLSVEEALRLTRQVAAALHYAHIQQLVHRDVKPENILLHEDEAMVADFGIVRAMSTTGSTLTETGIVIGTAAYMSPEQASGDPSLDAASDIYSLACVLFEMLTGMPPFTGPTALAVMAQRLTGPAPSVRRIRPEVPAAVDQAIAKALALQPSDRFSSAVAFAEALVSEPVGRSRARSVAVLPFLNLSTDPENEYFADGITEDVIAHLSKIRALQVISRTSVMPFKKREGGLREIASRLQVATVLDGSVRRAGARVRIVAQLIDAATDQHLWADTYDRQLTDIFAIQTDVALQIAGALRAELSPSEQTRVRREPTSDVRAYQLYLQGRHWFIRYTHEGMLKSIEYFEAALERDPNYALAYIGIALALAELVETGRLPPHEAYDRAKASVNTALMLEPDLAEAHATLGYLRFVVDFDWGGAEEALKRAVELNPGGADSYDHYGRLLSALGRFDEAIVMLERARELDPLAHRFDVMTAMLRAGRYEEVVRVARPGVELDPSASRGHATLGWAYLLSGNHAKGLAELEKAVANALGDPGWLAQLGEAYGIAGETERAREILAQLEELSRGRYVSPYHLAYVHTGLGNADAAIDLLERALEERSGAIYGVKGSFLFAPLRGHPRFKTLLRRMNLE